MSEKSQFTLGIFFFLVFAVLLIVALIFVFSSNSAKQNKQAKLMQQYIDERFQNAKTTISNFISTYENKECNGDICKDQNITNVKQILYILQLTLGAMAVDSVVPVVVVNMHEQNQTVYPKKYASIVDQCVDVTPRGTALIHALLCKPLS